ncbi:hypothetical protein K438DRAFT_180635 [Mycena galopus ATCC 62051]|nr:hypothetical protein K438DRAFT_180635 [Mycena galopus ATCC 62051]
MPVAFFRASTIFALASVLDVSGLQRKTIALPLSKRMSNYCFPTPGLSATSSPSTGRSLLNCRTSGCRSACIKNICSTSMDGGRIRFGVLVAVYRRRPRRVPSRSLQADGAGTARTSFTISTKAACASNEACAVSRASAAQAQATACGSR